MYRNAGSFAIAVHEVVGTDDPAYAQALALKEPDHLFAGSPGEV